MSAFEGLKPRLREAGRRGVRTDPGRSPIFARPLAGEPCNTAAKGFYIDATYLTRRKSKREPYLSVAAIGGIFLAINIIVGIVYALSKSQEIVTALLLSDPSLFVALYAFTHRNLLGWIIMVGTLAGTIYTVVINQILYMEILENLGGILFFISFPLSFFEVGKLIGKLTKKQQKREPYLSVGAIGFIFFIINLIVGVVAVLFNKQVINVLLFYDPLLFVALYAFTHRNLLGWIIMVGTLAGTIYTVVINQILYMEILDILGMILFFSSPIVTLFWVRTGTDSENTGSIRHDSRWSFPRTDDCWGSCESPTERYFREQFERSIREAQERQRELWKEKED